jgi:hypothetical protein
VTHPNTLTQAIPRVALGVSLSEGRQGDKPTKRREWLGKSEPDGRTTAHTERSDPKAHVYLSSGVEAWRYSGWQGGRVTTPAMGGRFKSWREWVTPPCGKVFHYICKVRFPSQKKRSRTLNPSNTLLTLHNPSIEGGLPSEASWPQSSLARVSAGRSASERPVECKSVRYGVHRHATSCSCRRRGATNA